MSKQIGKTRHQEHAADDGVEHEHAYGRVEVRTCHLHHDPQHREGEEEQTGEGEQRRSAQADAWAEEVAQLIELTESGAEGEEQSQTAPAFPGRADRGRGAWVVTRG